MFGQGPTRKIIRPDERGLAIAYTGSPVGEDGLENNLSFI
jgi:hypothetical protein